MGKNRNSTSGEDNMSGQVKLLVAQAIEDWKQEYLKVIKAQKNEISEVKVSQTFIGKQHENLKLENENFLETSKKQENEINLIKNQLIELVEKGAKETEKIDSVEHYCRHQNLEIVGIPEKVGEDSTKIVIEVAKLLQVEIGPKQISTSHRLSHKRKRDDTEG